MADSCENHDDDASVVASDFQGTHGAVHLGCPINPMPELGYGVVLAEVGVHSKSQQHLLNLKDGGCTLVLAAG